MNTKKVPQSELRKSKDSITEKDAEFVGEARSGCRLDFDSFADEGALATLEKHPVGKVVHYYPRVCAADIWIEVRGIYLGETILITGPTTGVVDFIAQSMRSSEDQQIDSAVPGETIGLAVPAKVRPGDKVYVMEI